MTIARLLPVAPFVAAVVIPAGCGGDRVAAPHDLPLASRDVARAERLSGASHADVKLRDAAGAAVGTAKFTEDATGRVHLTVHVRGVAPGLHGLHLHAVGACALGTAPAFSSAGGHYNPTGREHGHHNPLGAHAGDLPNVVVNAGGAGHLSVAVEQFALAALADADGTALVLHQNEDDRRTNAGALGPGNSGPRIACGVVGAR
jgi:Cu-Zn family superoxide dismutase